MGDSTAPLADEMVVRMLVRRLEVRAIATEIRPEQKTLGNEQIQSAVDSRRVDLRQPGADASDDLARTQMLVRLGRDRVPDQLPLAGEPPAARAQVSGLAQRRVGVSVGGLRLWHVNRMMPSRADRTESRTIANESRHSPDG